MTGPSLFDDEPTKPAKPAPTRGLTEVAKRSLVARGMMDERTGATQNARPARCENCKAPIIIGLVNPNFGTYAMELDPIPLSARGELAAILAGRSRYRLMLHGGRWEIAARDIFNLRVHPAGSNSKEDILIRHSCGEEFRFDSAPSNVQNRNSAVVKLPDKAPF